MDSFEISTDNYDPTDLITNQKANGEATAPPQRNQTRKKPEAEPDKPDARKKETAAENRNGMTSWEKWKIFIGIIFIVAAAYMLIVSISFFSSGAEDQSIVQGRDYSQIVENGDRIANTGGPTGAYLSDLLLSRWLGLGSFILIFYFGALGISLVRIHHFRFWNLTYKCLLTAVTLSILVGFITFSFPSHNYWGGDHGYAVNNYLISHTGLWGAIGINILLVAAVVLVFLRELQSAYNSYYRRIERHRQKVARDKAKREARKKKAKEMLEKEPIQTVIEPQPEEEYGTEGDNVDMVQPIYVAPQPQPFDDEPFVEIEPVPTVDGEKAGEPNPYPETPQPSAHSQVERIETARKPEQSLEEDIIIPQPAPAESDITTEGGETDSQIEIAPAFIDNTQKNTESGKEAAEPFPDVYDPTLELSRYRLPSLDLLDDKVARTDHVDMLEQEENKQRLRETLRTFGVKISHIEATVGPTITRYEIIPAEGVRTRSVKSLGEDLALTLQALGVRIIAPIPGKGTIGIEVPNKDPQTVYIRNVLASETFRNFNGELPIALGTTITNDVYVADLAKLPHLLVAGATGMGKSVGLKTIITSLLYKKHPAELKFVLVDPTRVELSLSKTLERHYLAALPGEDSIITDMSKVVTVLNSLCKEMEDRLGLLQAAEVRNIKEYNTKFIAKKLNPKKHRFLPYIVLIIDEFADIILTQGKEVENPVSRLAAVARAAGIHLIIATQRPSVNVITGGIKTNIPGRMAFRVNQGVDSRTIIDQVGANLLNGKGDMLFSRDGIIDRVQGAFISTDEVKAVVDSIGDQIGYDEPYQLPEFVDGAAEGGIAKGGALTDRDPMFEDAGRLVVNSNSGSTTMLQRKLSIGFGRAARIMDQLEIAGVVGPAQGGKPRDVLMDMYAFERYLNPPPPTAD